MADYKDPNKNIPLGSSILVRLNYCDEEGEIVEEKQFHGLVDKITSEEVVIKNQKSGEEVSLPPMFGSYEKPESPSFTMPKTGEQIDNIDFITEWTLRMSSGS